MVVMWAVVPIRGLGAPSGAASSGNGPGVTRGLMNPYPDTMCKKSTPRSRRPGRGEEVNELIAGANYGWPEEEGEEQKEASGSGGWVIISQDSQVVLKFIKICAGFEGYSEYRLR